MPSAKRSEKTVELPYIFFHDFEAPEEKKEAQPGAEAASTQLFFNVSLDAQKRIYKNRIWLGPDLTITGNFN